MAYAVVYGADERVARCKTATECRELVLALQLKGEQTIIIFDEQGAEVTLDKLKELQEGETGDLDDPTVVIGGRRER